MWVRLELHRQQADRLALEIPLRTRVLPALLSGWLLYALVGVSNGPIHAVQIVAMVLFALCALAALFDESWVFDMTQQKVFRRLGLLFAARESALDLGTLSRVVVSVQKAQDKQRPRNVLLALEDSAGNCHTLEQVRAAYTAELRAMAGEIAAFCRLPLEDRIQ